MDAKEFFGGTHITLFHGSLHQVKRPSFGTGNPNNDYGLAFYTTELQELAFEWACPSINDGWVNEYVFDTQNLKIVDLSSAKYSVLNWMAVLLEHRKVSLTPGIASQAREFIIKEYSVNLTEADIVHGYRADDSYFHIARSFLNNTIPVEVLTQALFLGGLGFQFAVKSKRAFDQLQWISAERAVGQTWHPKRMRRDANARATALRLEQESLISGSGTFIVDIMRKGSNWQQ